MRVQLSYNVPILTTIVEDRHLSVAVVPVNKQPAIRHWSSLRYVSPYPIRGAPEYQEDKVELPRDQRVKLMSFASRSSEISTGPKFRNVLFRRMPLLIRGPFLRWPTFTSTSQPPEPKANITSPSIAGDPGCITVPNGYLQRPDTGKFGRAPHNNNGRIIALKCFVDQLP